jgi:hypothetical protein
MAYNVDIPITIPLKNHTLPGSARVILVKVEMNGAIEWGGDGGSPSRSASGAAATADAGAKAQALGERAEGCTICAAPACVEPTRHDKCGNSFCRRCLLNWANAEFVRGRGLTCACARHSLGKAATAPPHAYAVALAHTHTLARAEAKC